MQVSNFQVDRGSNRWADASLFHAVATEAARRYPDAVSRYRFERVTPFLPTRTALAPTRLLRELRAVCLEAVGPAATFEIYANCGRERSYPHLLSMAAAPDAVSLVRRMQMVESMATRIAVTQIANSGERWIELRQQRNDPATAASLTYAVAYWGMIVGVFLASGRKGLALVAIDQPGSPVIAINGELRAEAVAVLPSVQCARLVWGTYKRKAIALLPAITATVDPPIIHRIKIAMSKAFESGTTLPSLPDVARLTYCSPRTVQRHLTAASITLQDIRVSVRMRRTALMLANTGDSLSEVAFSCGFSDAPHLVRDFKRVIGFTPEQYRMMNRL